MSIRKIGYIWPEIRINMGRKSMDDRAKVVLNPNAAKGYTVHVQRTLKEKIEVGTKICNLISTGKYTLEAVCARFNVRPIVFSQWTCPKLDVAGMIVRGEELPVRCIPELHRKYKDARKMAQNMYLAEVKDKAQRGLVAKIEGTEWEEVQEEMELDTEMHLPDGELNPNFGKMKVVKRKVKRGKNAPDTAAIIYALNNTDPENFKNTSFNKNLNATVPADSILGLESLSDEDLSNKRRALEQRLIAMKEKARNEDIEEAEEVEENYEDQ